LADLQNSIADTLSSILHLQNAVRMVIETKVLGK